VESGLTEVFSVRIRHGKITPEPLSKFEEEQKRKYRQEQQQQQQQQRKRGYKKSKYTKKKQKQQQQQQQQQQQASMERPPSLVLWRERDEAVIETLLAYDHGTAHHQRKKERWDTQPLHPTGAASWYSPDPLPNDRKQSQCFFQQSKRFDGSRTSAARHMQTMEFKQYSWNNATRRQQRICLYTMPLYVALAPSERVYPYTSTDFSNQVQQDQSRVVPVTYSYNHPSQLRANPWCFTRKTIQGEEHTPDDVTTTPRNITQQRQVWEALQQ
jgi:hypothetical protein